jgi:tRNA1(Val) A37 N6-methylase TrmN6
MGAYYTKEDITDYISKNCIIPWLFDETTRNYSKTFAVNEEIPAFLISSGDTYIYDAVKHGANEPLPKDIQAGIKDVSKRTYWNTTATPELGLPTEIWRETVERRKRYEEVKKKIKDGEIQSINDFITYNLNIRQFAQDVIVQTNDAEFLKAFYKALNKVTILDPTCGSGAFLFAAMNILEPLYHACITRMRAFTEDEDRHNEEKKKTFSNKYKFFREVLGNIQNEKHPNLEYFIYKSIILNNLYGVDIMKEAVEIAKLRLFLKLVATVEADYRKPNLGLEPLPDIDFNIRSGNTLVGFATETELQRGLTYTLDGVAAAPAIEEKCEIVANAFKRYKEIQLSFGDDYAEFKNAKKELNKRLQELNAELNKLLHKQADGIKYDLWLQNYQPFHWFAEFYEIIHDGKGFDVIIGNPPYVVYTPSFFNYKIKNYLTSSCSNLYAFCIERSFKLLEPCGRFGMIVPNSSISADKLFPLQKIFTSNGATWISNYAWRPAKLFEGANMLLAIILKTASQKISVNSTIYHKWYNDYREVLFENIQYFNTTSLIRTGSIPKVPSKLFIGIFKKLKSQSENKSLLNCFLPQANYYFYYFRAVLYWVKILDQEPIFREDGRQTVTGEMKPVYVQNEEEKYILIALLSSTLYFIHYIIWSSCQVINSRDFDFYFNLGKLTKVERLRLSELGKKLQKDFQKNSEVAVRNYAARGRSYVMEKQYFYIKKSKPIIDEIDKVLAQHYGFTDEELDFIINYDIKYRMGKELEGEEE